MRLLLSSLTWAIFVALFVLVVMAEPPRRTFIMGKDCTMVKDGIACILEEHKP